MRGGRSVRAATRSGKRSVARTVLCDAAREHSFKLGVHREAEAAGAASHFAGDVEALEAEQAALRMELGQQYEEPAPTAQFTANCRHRGEESKGA